MIHAHLTEFHWLSPLGALQGGLYGPGLSLQVLILLGQEVLWGYHQVPPH